MRKLLYISLALMLMACFMSCGRSVDKRLVLADSLMWINPDSSLSILEAINRDSLQGEENLAYHALLLTQAQFRCYGNCSSDSLISFALDYYSDNNNQERFTRSLIYKGAYYEERNNPVEAMKWYKQAEDNAGSNDYRNLAQINMRMGMLYYKNYASNNLDLEKFKKAYNYYKKIDDERMSMMALGYMGNLYRAIEHKRAIDCLCKAKDIAKTINDSNYYYVYLNELSLAFFMDSSYVDAKKSALECIYNTLPTNAMLFNAANAYAELNMPDSALYYLGKTAINPDNLYDKMMHIFALARIFKAQKKEADYLKYDKLGNSIADSIALMSSRNQLFAIEGNMDSSFKNSKLDKISFMEISLFVISLIILAIVFSYATNIWLLKRKYNNLLKNAEENKQITKKMLDDFESKKSERSNNETNIIINYLHEHFISLNQLIENSHNLSYKNFLDFFNKNALETGKNDNFWKASRIIADERSGNLVTELEEKSSLTESEIRVVSLICLGYKNDAIAACTGTSKDSVKSKKTRIKNKINVSMQLDSYIKQEINNRF